MFVLLTVMLTKACLLVEWGAIPQHISFHSHTRTTCQYSMHSSGPSHCLISLSYGL
jgi:hypothetical protein